MEEGEDEEKRSTEGREKLRKRIGQEMHVSLCMKEREDEEKKSTERKIRSRKQKERRKKRRSTERKIMSRNACEFVCERECVAVDS